VPRAGRDGFFPSDIARVSARVSGTKYSVSLSALLKRINRTAVAAAAGIVFVAAVVGTFAIGLAGLVQTAHVQARVLADSAVPPLQVRDPRAAQELLGSLRYWPQVVAAQIVGPDRRVFARYVRHRPGASDVPAGDAAVPSGLLGGVLTFRQVIDDGDGRMGVLTLSIGLGDLYRQTAWIGAAMFLATLAAVAVSGLLLRRLRPSVLVPMQALNRLMARVHGQSDYAVRARVSHVEEIDDLGRGFNAMIETIQDRDRQLARLAFCDNLTGLPNRHAFLDRLQREVQRSMRSGRRLGLLFLDLDGFKSVNDTLGHEIGDRLLVEAAQRLRDALRPSDTAAQMNAAPHDQAASRLGGDEFTVLVPDMHAVDDVMAVAQRVGEVLRRPFLIDGHELSISGSIGAAVFPDHGRDASELLRNADAAMYDAKRGGRDHCRLHGAAGAERAKDLPTRDLPTRDVPIRDPSRRTAHA